MREGDPHGDGFYGYQNDIVYYSVFFRGERRRRGGVCPSVLLNIDAAFTANDEKKCASVNTRCVPNTRNSL